jgi:N-acetyl-beta-hexosaminidase
MSAGQPQLTVIPYPSSVEYVGTSSYILPRAPRISSSAALQPQAEYLQAALQQRFSTPSNLQQQQEARENASQSSISLDIVEDLPALWPYRFSHEGYELVCAESGIAIRALSTTGIFYGIQTLLQALSVDTAGQQGLRMPHTRVSRVV